MSGGVGSAVQPDWSEADWELLLLAIRNRQCTPFLGAGACAGVLPLGGDIAERWAAEYGYPFPDRRNLPKVAQYMAVHHSAMLPKLKIVEMFGARGLPDFNNPSEPHRLVADLNLPVYITTNYDDFLVQAIEARGGPQRRQARRKVCRWHEAGQPKRSPGGLVDLDASAENPVVFHLHGTLDDLPSMVLTEDDYLDFLMAISEVQELIPPRIEKAFSSSALLFLGYSLEDLNFKVLFRKLATYMRRNEGARHVSVQLKPSKENPTAEELESIERQSRYLQKHFDLMKVHVYWGTCEKFATDLRNRLEAARVGR